MYAIYWIDSDGTTGHGEHILDEATLCAWLDRLRTRYPEISHWGEDKNGERYVPTTRSPSQVGDPLTPSSGHRVTQTSPREQRK